MRRIRRGLGTALVLGLSGAAAYAAGTLYRDAAAAAPAACSRDPAAAAGQAPPEPGPGSAERVRAARTES